MSKFYSYEEALIESKKYFNGDELAAKVFLDKYALRDLDQNLIEKTPEDMHWRIAKEFARIEKNKYQNTNIKPLTKKEIFKFLDKYRYIVPQGSPMYGIGNPFQTVSVSNCFVTPSPEDSYAGICKTDEELAQISKRRGGVGTDISNLRTDGSKTHNAARTSTGIIPFMTRFSNTIREVGQNGRRGAEMLTLSIHHPQSVIPWNQEEDGIPYEVEIRDGDIGNFNISSKYYNPKKVDFATSKYDKKNVTGANISLRLTDEFLKSVKKNRDYEQRFPVDIDKFEEFKSAGKEVISKKVKAKEVWDKIIHSAWQTAEPGILFWDNILRNSPADCYADCGFKTISTNPCFSGDSLIAVADGRNAVSIKQLAEEGKDVPVYSVDTKTGRVEIKWGRNPRKTGTNKELVRIYFDNGSHLDVTPDHKIPLKNGDTKEAKDLEYGDSLFRFRKTPEKTTKNNSNEYYQVQCNSIKMNDVRLFEHRLISEFYYPEKWEEMHDEEKSNGWANGGLVVHHKDYNGLNNAIDNLELMSFKDHQQFHADHDCAGEKNGRHSGFSNEQLEGFAIQLTKNLNKRFSKRDWITFAKDNGLPQSFSAYRRNGWFNSVKDLAIWAANECGIENTDVDPRLVRTYNSMIKQGYVSKIENNEVWVQKICEYSGESFWVNHNQRNISFANQKNALAKLNQDKELHKSRIKKALKTYEEKSHKTKKDQSRVFSQLLFDLNREPLLSEWEEECRRQGVSFRLRTKYGFSNFKEVKESGLVYNHKVIKVERLEGRQDVYNITVDDNHTVAIVNKTKFNKNNNIIFDGVIVYNCGEIPLSAYDSCRLLLLNLLSFVENPFTENAYFNFNKFYEYSQIAQRLMDDLVDIEEESIQRIIDKIKIDPEDDNVKYRELYLWNKVLETCRKGRRTGTGITALGDTFAALGLGYATDESIELTGKIYKTLKFGAYQSSIDMAKEIGAFSVWDSKKEKDCEFFKRFDSEELDLGDRVILGKDVIAEMNKYGRRNIALLTTAPAGSVSIQTQTSSGIEPVFMLYYKRRKKINPNDKNTRTDFVDQSGDHWQEFIIYHNTVKKWMEATGEDDVSKSPWNGFCASDLNWKNRVKLQAIAQSHVDHSISSTINLPEDVSVEQVKEIYETAWEAGCKGITVYRDNCRSGVLVDTKDKEEVNSQPDNKILKTDAPKRPKVLKCDVHHVKVTKKLDKPRTFDYLVVVGLLNNEPYEVFVKENGTLSRKYKDGEITKVKRGVYRVDFEDGTFIDDITADTSEGEDSVTRLASTSLRHGADIHHVVEQLEKAEGDMWSFSKAISRALKKYIKDGTKVTGLSCPNCDSSSLERKEGCITCMSCGWSKCS